MWYRWRCIDTFVSKSEDHCGSWSGSHWCHLIHRSWLYSNCRYLHPLLSYKIWTKSTEPFFWNFPKTSPSHWFQWGKFSIEMNARQMEFSAKVHDQNSILDKHCLHIIRCIRTLSMDCVLESQFGILIFWTLGISKLTFSLFTVVMILILFLNLEVSNRSPSLVYVRIYPILNLLKCGRIWSHWPWWSATWET